MSASPVASPPGPPRGTRRPLPPAPGDPRPGTGRDARGTRRPARHLRDLASRYLKDVVVGVVGACLVAGAILAAYALAYRFWADGLERARERGSVTAVGAVLTLSQPLAMLTPDPGMSGPGCVLPEGSVARSLGEADEAHVKVVVASVAPGRDPAAPGPPNCVAETVGYADLYGTWLVRHHD